jgi:hypothetical protein
VTLIWRRTRAYGDVAAAGKVTESDLIGAPEPMSIEAVLADHRRVGARLPGAVPITKSDGELGQRCGRIDYESAAIPSVRWTD